MGREYVESTAVDWFEHHPETDTLESQYVGGAVYRYVDVPPDVVVELRVAESKGTFVNLEIKPDYDYVRISRNAGP